MAQEHDHLPTLSQSVRDFIAAEAARRGIRRWEACVSELMREMGIAIELEGKGEDDLPPAPAEDSPDYNPVVHGARSDSEVVDLLRSRIDDIGKGNWWTMDDLKEMEKDTFRRLGLTPQ